MLQILGPKDFLQIYEIMEQSFPQEEHRLYEGQLGLMDRSHYKVYGVWEPSGELGGFMAVWELDDWCFLEHFAVAPSRRNSGLGSSMLKELQAMYAVPICLEAEPPENELTSRRVGFYERNGFYLNPYAYEQPSLGEGRHPVPLQIMTTEEPLTQEGFHSLKALLYTRVYHVPAKK